MLTQPRGGQTVEELVLFFVERLRDAAASGVTSFNELLQDTKTIAYLDPDLARAIRNQLVDMASNHVSEVRIAPVVSKTLEQINSILNSASTGREQLLKHFGVTPAEARDWLRRNDLLFSQMGRLGTYEWAKCVDYRRPDVERLKRQFDVVSTVRGVPEGPGEVGRWTFRNGQPVLSHKYLMTRLILRIKQVAVRHPDELPELLYDAENIAFHDPPLAAEILSRLEVEVAVERHGRVREVEESVIDVIETMADSDWMEVMLEAVDVPEEIIGDDKLRNAYLEPIRKQLKRRYKNEKEMYWPLAAVTGEGAYRTPQENLGIPRDTPASRDAGVAPIANDGLEPKPAGGTRRRLTEEDDRLIRHLYVDEELGLVKVAARIGCSDSTVLEHLVRMGIPRRSSKAASVIPPERLEKMRYLYEVEGLGTRSVAQRIGLPEGQVRRHLIAAGVTLRPAGSSPNAEAVEMRDEMKRLYLDEELSLHKIKERLGFSVNTIRNHLLQVGVSMRPRPGWKRGNSGHLKG
ncbi:hypothetical protein [Leucobacter celer]|uniref:hypothetical protein n=1 Tax=Leucobacter celer TaxID=668625 RepID=UPI0019D388AC|nr:hypothetical protein [Leucobacter celer]